jgi:hypothetical protein
MFVLQLILGKELRGELGAVAVTKMIFTGGDGWSIEFGTPDCQHGYAILKGGTGQSIGCYLTKAEAEEALKGLDNPKIDLLSDEVRTTKTPEEYKENNVVNKCMTCGCDDLGNDHHYISDEEKCLSCMTKGQGPCWDGYEYIGTKEQNGKTVPDCVPIKKSIWDGVFVPSNKGQMGPDFNTQMQDARYYFPSKASYENDGKPSAGYGNRSSNQSIPEGNNVTDKTTRPYKDNK